jgi:hypothetical protein
MTAEEKKAVGERLEKARAAKKAQARPTAEIPLGMVVVDPPSESPAKELAYNWVTPPKLPKPERGFMPSKDEMTAMEDVAGMLKGTGMLPPELDTKDKVLLVMLKGWELGLTPLRSVEGLYLKVEKDDDGAVRTRILQRADLMRELVQRSGRGIIVPIETTNEKATVRATLYGIRGRADATHDVTYTLEDARQAGLLKQDMWKANPRACLFATASSTAVRMHFADVLHGVIYTPEELGVTEVKGAAERPVVVASQAPEIVPGTDSTSTQGEAGSPDNSAQTEATAHPVRAGEQVPAETKPPVSSEPPVPADPNAPPADRPLTLSFLMADKDGAAVPMQTSGITRLTVLELLRRQKLSQAAADTVAATMTKLGIGRLRYLREDEGIALLNLLPPSAQSAPQTAVASPPTPANGGAATQATPKAVQPVQTPQEAIAFIAQLIEMRPADVTAFILGTHQVDSLVKLSADEIDRTLREIRATYLADKDALRLMIGRSQAQAG